MGPSSPSEAHRLRGRGGTGAYQPDRPPPPPGPSHAGRRSSRATSRQGGAHEHHRDPPARPGWRSSPAGGRPGPAATTRPWPAGSSSWPNAWPTPPTCGPGSGSWTWPAAAATPPWPRPAVAVRSPASTTSPELLDRGRERAAAEGLSVDFAEGDAEVLQFPDGPSTPCCPVSG